MKIDAYSLPVGELAGASVPHSALLGQSAAISTTPIIAQQFEDNLFSHSGDIIGNFVESGQLWA
ncbi:MAG: hypothetical protein AAGF93_18225, partial [Cyanobacteria bacterium P01_H01_bin.105]